MDSIRVRKQSYPVRKLYKQFFERYQEIDDGEIGKTKIETLINKGSSFQDLAMKFLIPLFKYLKILFINTD